MSLELSDGGEEFEIVIFTIAGGHTALETLENIAPAIFKEYGAKLSVYFSNGMVTCIVCICFSDNACAMHIV